MLLKIADTPSSLNVLTAQSDTAAFSSISSSPIHAVSLHSARNKVQYSIRTSASLPIQPSTILQKLLPLGLIPLSTTTRCILGQSAGAAMDAHLESREPSPPVVVV